MGACYTPEAIPALLDAAVTEFPDNPAIDFLGHKLTYSELDALVSRAACGLQKLGLAPASMWGCICPTARITSSVFSCAARRRDGGELFTAGC
ncbi:hypothetical protein UMZ34_06810 [Halopseudomonas pachastrellae]|nr:hypothetical protein UMZ34_06810 [Halopseudomonas pachastrellae]